MNRLFAVTVVAFGALVAVWAFPVGGFVWSTGQVSAIKLLEPGRETEVRHPVPIREAVLEARVDRFRRLFPESRCRTVSLQLETAMGWYPVQLRCANPLFLDYLPPAFSQAKL